MLSAATTLSLMICGSTGGHDSLWGSSWSHQRYFLIRLNSHARLNIGLVGADVDILSVLRNYLHITLRH